MNVIIKNLTFTNGKYIGGGAIHNDGALDATSCAFINNYSSGLGGAIDNEGETTSTINKCTFIGNRALGNGGAIESNGLSILILNQSIFINNTGYYGGAVRVFNTFTTHFNAFVGNTALVGSDISFAMGGGTFNVENNWWGSNSGPAAGSINGGSYPENWVILGITANPKTINYGKTSNVVADFKHVNGGGDLIGGNIPDDIPVVFNTAWGSITDSSSTTKDGVVTATFKANGPSYTPSTDVYASADNEQNTVYTTINIEKITTTTTVNFAHGTRGHTVDLTAHVVDSDSNPVNDGQVRFYVGTAPYVTAEIHDGYATYSGWTIPSDWDAKQYGITAVYLGTSIYQTSNGQNILLVEPKTTTTRVDSAWGTRGHTVDLVAHVVDSDGKPVDEGQVMFNVGSAPPVVADVKNGVATYSGWLIPSNWPSVKYNLVAIYMGTANYLSSADQNALVVDPKTTTSTVDPAHNFAGHQVDLTAHVVDSDGNPVNEGLVQFNVGNAQTIAALVHNGVAVFTGWMIPSNWKSGNYDIVATFLGTINYKISTNKNTLTVNPTPTTIKVNDLSGNKGETVNLTALLEDATYGHLLAGKTVKFYVNGTFIGTSVTNFAGIALLPYKITENHGYYYIDAVFNGDDVFNGSSGGANLDVHQSDLYVTVKTSNSHPKIGEKIFLTFKVGNRGPDTANNVVFTFKVPEGMEFVDVNVDTGSYTYNADTRTVTWTIGDVPVGDPKLVMGLKVLKAGKYTIRPGLSTSTYDPNLSSNIGTVNINVSNNKPVVHGQTVPMQPTGTPIVPLLIGLLLTAAGLITTRKN